MTTSPVAVIVEVDSLWKTIAASLAAEVGITLAFSSALLGLTRATEAQRDQRTAAAAAWVTVAAIGAVAVAGGIILGLIAMTDK